MKTTLSLLVLTTLLLGELSANELEKPKEVELLMFKVRVLEGDPLGSREAGTIKVLAEPTLITTENRPFSLAVGGEIPFNDGEGQIQFVETGLKMDGKPTIVNDGKLRLDLTLTNTVVEYQSDEQLQLSTIGIRVISSARLGEVARFRFGKKEAQSDQQQWLEITPELVRSSETE